MSEQHEMINYPPKVSFDYEGNAVPHICIAVIDGRLCGKSYSESVHTPDPRTLVVSGTPITEGPWAGWREMGCTTAPRW